MLANLALLLAPFFHNPAPLELSDYPSGLTDEARWEFERRRLGVLPERVR